ncbi:MAG: DUF4369 domain-containing protein [Bacteroidales bacterium]|nr:DUF4369 domain-containing protein [Bacteroidales bacterium]
MNKIISYVSFVWLLVFVSCGNEKTGFSIEGTLDNREGKPLFAIYENQEKLYIDTLFPQNGFISLKGEAKALTPVQFYRADKSKYLRLYVKNGDRIELKGDSREPYELNIKGSDLDKELLQFCRDNKSLLNALDSERQEVLKAGVISERLAALNKELSEKVTKYVTGHKNSVLSSILLYDFMPVYSDFSPCDSLFRVISPSAIPPYIVGKWEYLRDKDRKLSTDSVFGGFSFIDKKDSLRVYETPYEQMMLFYFWKTGNKRSQQDFNILRDLYKEYGKNGLDIVTISLEPDSSAWRRTLGTDSVPGTSLWANGGFANKTIMNSGVPCIPFYVVTDTLGMIIAKGMESDTLKEFIEKKMSGAKERKVSDN